MSNNLTDRLNAAFSDNPVASEQSSINSNNKASTSIQPLSTKHVPPTAVDIRQSNSGLAKSLGGDYVYNDQNKGQLSPFASDYFNAKWLGIDFGKVTREFEDEQRGTNPFSHAADAELVRRNAQSIGGVAINLATQFIGKTTVNTVGGLVGGFYSLGAAAVQGIKNGFIDDDKETLQGRTLLFDNSFNRLLDKGTEAVESGNSVFTSSRARNDLGFFSFETVKDINDAYSFIAGAVASELILGVATGGSSLTMLPTKAVSFAGKFADKATRFAQNTVGLNRNMRTYGNFITRGEEVAKLLSSVDPNDARKLTQIAQHYGLSVDDMIKYKKTVDEVASFGRQARRTFTGTFWESGLEARQSKQAILDSDLAKLEESMNKMSFDSEEEKENYKQTQLKRINENADIAGLATFGLNVGVLSVSNAIQFPTLFGSGPSGVNTNRMAGKLTRKSLNEYTKQGGKLKDVAKLTFSALKSPITEFTEETLQKAISTGSKTYYESMLGVGTNAGELMTSTASVSDAIYSGLKDAYGTENGRYEGYIGAIVGAIGMPMLKKNKSGKLRSLTMNGGIFESVKENRAENKSIKEAIDFLNLGGHDSVLGYNRDNAILSSLDAKKMDVANYNEDKFEVQRLKDNIVWRFVQERMDKGLESYVKEDIKDMKDMSLEDYKKVFKKGDNFSQGNKDQEVNAFADKAEIYMDAYKKTYEGIKTDNMDNSSLAKKYFDISAYSLANEKIYKQKQDYLTEQLLANPNMAMSENEIKRYSYLSDQFKDYQQDIQDLINAEQINLNEKFEAKKRPLTKTLDDLKGSEYLSESGRKLIDEIGTENDPTEYLRKITELKAEFNSEAYNQRAQDADTILLFEEEIKNINKELAKLEKDKAKLTRVNTGRFGPIRTLKGNESQVLENINQDIAKKASKSLDILRNKKDSVNQVDLREYLELKQKVEEAKKNEKNNPKQTKPLLDALETTQNKELQEILDELEDVSKHQILSLEIASNLYGLSNVNKRYNDVLIASFSANIENLKSQELMARILIKIGDIDEDIVAQSASLEASINNVEKDLEEFGNKLNKEFLETLKLGIDEAKKTLEELNNLIEIEDEKEENAKEKAIKDKKEDDDKKIKSIKKKEKENEENKKEVDKAEKGDIKGEEFDQESPNLSKNLHSIKLINPENKDQIALKEKFDKGEIKYNSGVILNYQETNEETKSFLDYLEKNKVTESYQAGKSKVIENPSELEKDFEEMDVDVRNFVIHSPVKFNIYDKQVITIEGKQYLDVEDASLVHEMLYYSPKFKEGDQTNIDTYNEKKKALLDKFKKDISDLYDLKNGKSNKAEIERGKVGNTEYEVKVDGVYYQGKKLNNPENKTHRQLIEADIERRRQEELDDLPNRENPLNTEKENIELLKDIENKINAKYDAELAKLEEPNSELEAKKADIERRRQELTTFTYKRTFIKGVAHEIQIAKKFNQEGFDVDVSNKADSSTGFLYSNVLSEHFDTIEEAIEYANQIIQGDKEYIKKVDVELAALENTEKITEQEFQKRKAQIEKKHSKYLLDLEAKFKTEFNNLNEHALFKIRKALLSNRYSEEGVNELKMRLGNIINGYLEKAGDTQYDVEEYALNDEVNPLVSNISEIGPENLLFSKVKGEYYNFNGTRVKLNKGSLYEHHKGINSRIYYIHETPNGQKIPVLLNRSKIGNNTMLFDEISFQLEEYFKNGMKEGSKIVLKNKELSFLRNKTYSEFFTAFFDRNKTDTRIDGSLMTLNIVKGGGVFLGNKYLAINSLDVFNANKDEIIKSMAEMRYYMNASSFTKDDGSFNKEFLDFVINNKMINHSFNTSQNRDKVFLKNDNEGKDFVRSMQFHVLNSEFKINYEKDAIRTSELSSLMTALFGQNKNANLSSANLFYNLNSDIIERAKKLRDADISGMSDIDIVKKAIQEIFEEKENSIARLAELRPDQYTEGTLEDLRDNPKKKIVYSTNKIVDNAYKILYTYINKSKDTDNFEEAFLTVFKNRNYDLDYKEILIDKALGKVRTSLDEGIEKIEVTEDDETISKNSFKLKMDEELTSGTKEENKEKALNFLEKITELRSSLIYFGPKIFGKHKHNKQNNYKEIYFEFSKKYMGNDGKSFTNSTILKIDEKTKMVVGGDTSSKNSNKPAYDNAFAEFSGATKGSKTPAIQFFIQKEVKGELVEVEEKNTDNFEFDENGIIKNGIIYVGVKEYGAGGKFYNKKILLFKGSQNKLVVREYISNMKIPGLNSDFTTNEQNDTKLKNLIYTFQTGYDKMNEMTKGVLPEVLKEKIEFESEEDAENKKWADDQFKKFSNPEQPTEKKLKDEVEDKEDIVVYDDSSELSSRLNPEEDSEYNIDTEDAFDMDEYTGAVETAEETSRLTLEDRNRFSRESSIWKGRIDRWSKGETKSDIILSTLSKGGVETYQDLKDVIQIIYNKKTDELKKMLKFAQKLFDVIDDNDITC